MNVSAESGAPRRAGQRHEVGLAQLPPAPPTTVAVIEGLATGTPRRVVNQSDAADRVAELFLDPGQRERIPRVYQKSRITTRRMAVDPLDAKFDVFRREPATIRDRMHLFYEHAVPLAVDVSKRVKRSTRHIFRPTANERAPIGALGRAGDRPRRPFKCACA